VGEKSGGVNQRTARLRRTRALGKRVWEHLEQRGGGGGAAAHLAHDIHVRQHPQRRCSHPPPPTPPLSSAREERQSVATPPAARGLARPAAPSRTNLASVLRLLSTPGVGSAPVARRKSVSSGLSNSVKRNSAVVGASGRARLNTQAAACCANVTTVTAAAATNTPDTPIDQCTSALHPHQASQRSGDRVPGWVRAPRP
jgi:hypothetical protein